MNRILLLILIPLLLSACEEVIEVDLNTANPVLVVEGVIAHHSFARVRLTHTRSYFSLEEVEVVPDAVLRISDGQQTEYLSYVGNGNYAGDSIRGREGMSYVLEIYYGGKWYRGQSTMPGKAQILSLWYSKSKETSIFNPLGETVFTISLSFREDPEVDNYFMVRFIRDGELLEQRYFMITETTHNGGGLGRTEDQSMVFSESIFCDEGQATVELYSLDEQLYNYFMQVDDIMFWKRRAMPPAFYNPESNIDGGALGFFASWGWDGRLIVLE